MIKKKKIKDKQAYVLIENFSDKESTETWLFSIADFKKALAKSKADSFSVRVLIVKIIENEGEYKTKKDATYAFNCFIEK